jgi:hypothetical protein
MPSADGEFAEVVALELALLSSRVRSSTGLLETLLDPEFRQIGASGRLWARSETVPALAAEDPDSEGTIEVSEMETAVVADRVVLVTYVSDRAGRRARRSSLWRHREVAWRIAFHQGTLLP